MSKRLSAITLSGRYFSSKDIKTIKEVISLYPNLSRTELSKTICEILEWHQNNGEPKWMACMPALEKLESKGYISLPTLKDTGLKGTHRTVKHTEKSDPGKELTGKINEYNTVKLEIVSGKEETLLWREYIDRYHYLGDKSAFGSQLKYFVRFDSGELLGCLQFSASAWSIDSRDKWIGWNISQKSKNLHLIVGNSRYLIFPWIKLKNLASKVLSIAIRQVPKDWERRYCYRPVMFESFIDKGKFKGVCYQASNWRYIGTTTGRGRMDRHHKKHLSSPKELYVYPLHKNFRKELLGEVSK